MADSFAQSEQYCGRDISDFDNVIDGTSGNDKGKDKLVGTNGDDLIRGFGGDDELEGKDGDDCLLGGDGKDNLKGGKGNDDIFGDAGKDDLKGEDGDDFLDGGEGDDKLDGGKQNDTCFVDSEDKSEPKQCEIVDGLEPELEKPGKVESLTGEPGSSQVSLTWSAPTDGGTVGWYKIDYKEKGGDKQHIDNLDASLRDYVVTGLTNGIEYEFKIQAKNDEGPGDWSDKIYLTPLESDTEPNPSLLPPTNLKSTVDGSLVILTWDAPKESQKVLSIRNSDSGVIDYVIEYTTGDGYWIVANDGVNTETEIRSDGVPVNQLYEVRVSAQYVEGISEPTDTVFVKVESKKGGGDSTTPAPIILGIGIYQIIPVSDSQSSIEPTNFEEFFPYSTSTYNTDKENYKELGSFYKTGRFYGTGLDWSSFPTIVGKVNQPIQFQFQVLDPKNKEPIHAALYLNMKIMDIKHSDIAIYYDLNNEEEVTIDDPNGFIKEATVSVSLDDEFWITFDIIFAKPLEKSGGIFEVWNEGRLSRTIESPNDVLEIVDTFEFDDKEIGLNAKVEILLGASSPGCQSCFDPSTVEILQGGVITWENKDVFSHVLRLGSPDQKNGWGFEKLLKPNEKFSYKFDAAITYQYHSMSYPWATGAIVVHDTIENLKQEIVVETYQEHQTGIVDESGRNISGTLVLDELIDYPIKLESNASGKTKIIYTDDVVVLPYKDLRMEISGNVEYALTNAREMDLVILRPDNTVTELKIKINSDGEYSSPLTLHTRWMEGTYAILATVGDIEIGKTSFFVTDKISEFGALKGESSDSIYPITQYRNLEISESQLVTELQNIGWSDEKIQDFIEKNPLPNPYSLFIVVAILLPLLVIITTILSPKRN